jgi:hypothetical protein
MASGNHVIEVAVCDQSLLRIGKSRGIVSLWMLRIVDFEPSILDHDPIAGQSDDTLHQNQTRIPGKSENHDFSVSRTMGFPAEELEDFRFCHVELGDEKEVSRFQCGLHAPPEHMKRAQDEGLKQEQDP